MWCSTISTVLRSSAWTARISSTSSRHVLDRDAGHRLVEQQHRACRRRAASRARACACRRARASRPARAARRPSPTRSSAPSARSTASRTRARPPPDAAACRRAPPPLRGGRSRATVSSGKTFDTWKVRPSPCARAAVAAAGRDVRAVERDRARRRPQRPESRLNSDVLPAPFGPMTPRSSPSATSSADIGDDGGAADVEPEVSRARGSEAALTIAVVCSGPRDGSAGSLPGGAVCVRRSPCRELGLQPFTCDAAETWNIGCSIAWSAAGSLLALRREELPALERGDHLVHVVSPPVWSAWHDHLRRRRSRPA